MNNFNNSPHICREYAGEGKMIGVIGRIGSSRDKKILPQKRTFKAESATPSKKRATLVEPLKRFYPKNRK